MIDWTRVNDLRDEIGAENFDEVVTLFLDEADESVAMLLPDLPHDQLATALHSLKGSALNLGFRALAQLCAEAEAIASGGCSPDISALKAVYAQSRQRFQDGANAAAA